MDYVYGDGQVGVLQVLREEVPLDEAELLLALQELFQHGHHMTLTRVEVYQVRILIDSLCRFNYRLFIQLNQGEIA